MGRKKFWETREEMLRGLGMLATQLTLCVFLLVLGFTQCNR